VQESSIATTIDELVSNFTKKPSTKVSCPRNVCSDFTFVHTHTHTHIYIPRNLIAFPPLCICMRCNSLSEHRSQKRLLSSGYLVVNFELVISAHVDVRSRVPLRRVGTSAISLS